MTLAHLHLVLNHIPLIAIPVALVFLLHGILSEHAKAVRFAYGVLALAALLVIPVFLTGEPAEELVEHLPGVSEAILEEHEDLGKVSLVLTLLAGAASLFGFFAGERGAKAKGVRIAVFGLSLLAILSLAFTSNLGGKIRRPELSEQGATISAPHEGDHD